ncbi:hypothetical protein RJ639_039048 [Escallonia herrerae]|uniref:Cysteine-rich receptor-like protein kinase 42 n=1 Tax=Escallonia herrerae TaxID=1293975 RepID=A0AA88WJL2_9ASTE|nr:hypothetical protein RJ639_039048 [Escallonia herrerae]
MEALLQLVNVHRWGHHHTKTNSTSFPPVYALSQCFQHLSKADCLLCHSQSCVTLSRCLPVTSGRVFYDGCFLRYDNYSFFNESVDPNRDTVKCSGASATKLGFQKDVGELIENVTESATAKGGFAVVEGEGVYALAQCWESVSSAGCRDCLEKASKEVRGCLPSREGRGLNAGCYLRYSTEKFFSNDKAEEKKSGLFTLGEMVAIAFASVTFLLLSFFAAYATYARLSKLKAERGNLGHISGSIRISSLMYKYETLEKATNYFDISRKIGQGGAGSVFIGTLPKGKNVAVKRLFYNTRQWVDEFFNEVNLISGIQHKNLVKLLGCSIEGPESLLVYEYVPNKSLDQFLFGIVWIFYKVDKSIELVDPCLKGNFPVEEASKALAIALLCTQASAALRPAMSEVVRMLSDKDYEIPMPHQPPFLNARVLGPANSARALSVDSMITNLLTKVEIFCSSSASSDIQSSDGPPNSYDLKDK